MFTQGKLEISIKINEMPKEVKNIANGWKEFITDAEGREITIAVRPKVFNKLEFAQTNHPQWVSSIAGKMGKNTDKGFLLDNLNIQIFEKKSKLEEPANPQPTE